MSDDLISRKEALERLRLLRKFNPQEVMQVAVDAAEQQINFCRTAFDKEKVHDELVKLRNAEIYNPDATNKYDEARSQGRYSAFLDAIRIVEKGGIK